MDDNEDTQGDLEGGMDNPKDSPQENETVAKNETKEMSDNEENNGKSTENNGTPLEDENEQKDDGDASVKKSKKLFFCNINRSSDLSNIFKVFRSYGQICDILILKDKNGHSLGRGFVEFVLETDAEKALNGLNNTYVNGLKISINFATPRVRKASDVEYKQDPDKLDEDMRRKDIRLKMKTENLARYQKNQSMHNSRYKHRPFRDDFADYSRNQDQYDYMSDYDPYGYDADDRDFNDRRIRRDRDRRYPIDRDRERYADRDRGYNREFDRDRDQDYYNHHGRPPVSYVQDSRRAVSSIPVMRGPYRSDMLPPNSGMDSGRGRPPPSHSRSRRANDDYDFDYDYDRDHSNHDRRRRIQPIQTQHQVRMAGSSYQMVSYPSQQVVYQPGVGRSNSSPAASNASENSSSSIRRYQDDMRLQRTQPSSKQMPEEDQRGYWKDDNYDQRNYRRRDRI